MAEEGATVIALGRTSCFLFGIWSILRRNKNEFEISLNKLKTGKQVSARS